MQKRLNTIYGNTEFCDQLKKTTNWINWKETNRLGQNDGRNNCLATNKKCAFSVLISLAQQLYRLFGACGQAGASPGLKSFWSMARGSGRPQNPAIGWQPPGKKLFQAALPTFSVAFVPTVANWPWNL